MFNYHAISRDVPVFFFFVTPPGGFWYIYFLSNIRTITILHVPERDTKQKIVFAITYQNQNKIYIICF